MLWPVWVLSIIQAWAFEAILRILLAKSFFKAILEALDASIHIFRQFWDLAYSGRYHHFGGFRGYSGYCQAITDSGRFSIWRFLRLQRVLSSNNRVKTVNAGQHPELPSFHLLSSFAIISSSFLVTIISSSFFLAFFDMSWNNFVGETKIDDGKENGRGALLYHFPPLSASIFAGAKKMVSNHGSPPKCPHWSLLFYFSLHSSFFLHFLPF